MDCTLGLITQDRGLEKVLGRISNQFGCTLRIFESCIDFVQGLEEKKGGVVVVDGTVCAQPRLMDLQMVLNEGHHWKVVYLPRTKRINEVKEAVELGIFGSLHKPVSELEVKQMVQSAIGI